MKKILVMGLLAISAIALTQQEASAWVNSRFGIGMNWDWQSGGNSALWGLWRNGQPPGPEAYGCPGGPRPPMVHQPYGFNPAQQQPGLGVSPTNSPPPPGFGPQSGFGVPSGGAPMSMQPMYQGNLYQTANFPRPVYYYPTPYYYGR